MALDHTVLIGDWVCNEVQRFSIRPEHIHNNLLVGLEIQLYATEVVCGILRKFVGPINYTFKATPGDQETDRQMRFSASSILNSHHHAWREKCPNKPVEELHEFNYIAEHVNVMVYIRHHHTREPDLISIDDDPNYYFRGEYWRHAPGDRIPPISSLQVDSQLWDET